MLRTKITEIGKLSLLDDGGLVCLVTLDDPPSLDPSVLKASFMWASVDLNELAIGDPVAHWNRGVARYRGCKSFDGPSGEKIDYLVLEFGPGREYFVPAGRRHLVQKIGETTHQLLRSRTYCIEALPNAYAWHGIGTFPEYPKDPHDPHRSEKAMSLDRIMQGKIQRKERQEAEVQFSDLAAEWRTASAAYRTALHADSSYRQAAQEYFERQDSEPLPLLDWWTYRAVVLRVGPVDWANVRNRDELNLLIKQYVLRRDRGIEKLRREVEILENYGRLASAPRESIPEEVRLFVWRRDNGQCVRCGSRERLEFDHIIPVIAGGSYTERNVQLLCESCNRSKGATV